MPQWSSSSFSLLDFVAFFTGAYPTPSQWSLGVLKAPDDYLFGELQKQGRKT
jgi:hypothetical protein